MEIQDIRRDRLRELIRERFNGRQADFIAATEINQGELSLLLRKKAFGEKKARKIERLVGLEDGWLDRPVGDATKPTSTGAKDLRAERILFDYSFLTEPQKKEIAAKIASMADANRMLIKELSSGKLNPPSDDYVDRLLNHSEKRGHKAGRKA